MICEPAIDTLAASAEPSPVQPPRFVQQKCPTCQGSRYTKQNHTNLATHQCWECEGKGYITVAYEAPPPATPPQPISPLSDPVDPRKLRTPDSPPELGFTVQLKPLGIDNQLRPQKVSTTRDNGKYVGQCEWLMGDELAMWENITWLTRELERSKAENAQLKAENERVSAERDGLLRLIDPPAATPSAETPATEPEAKAA